MNPIAVLLMAYGTPNSLDEIEPYYTDIRRGHKPSPELVRELTERYVQIGGRTPLLELTQAQAAALQNELGDGSRVYIGMKHWQPRIADAVAEIRRAGHAQVVALALAPHYSRYSIDGYVERVRAAMASAGASFDVTFVESWNDHPRYIASLVERMEAMRRQMGAARWHELYVLFSAHSLPERILQGGDPYPQELRETCELVASALGLAPDGWGLTYQSAGRTGEKWLGPDLLDALAAAAAAGHRRILSAPIGFVCDHLEILYDIDIEGMACAAKLGIELARIPSANATPTFITALAEIVRAHASDSGLR